MTCEQLVVSHFGTCICVLERRAARRDARIDKGARMFQAGTARAKR